MTRQQKYTKISELKKKFSLLLRDTPLGEFPQKLVFQEKPQANEYTITIEAQETESFVDEKGKQWLRGK